MAMYEGSMLTHPDLCVIIKSSRVVRELPVVIGAPLTGDAASSSGASSSSASSSSASSSSASASASSSSASSSSASASSSSNGPSNSSSGIHRSSRSKSSSGATTQCSSACDGDDEKMNSADTLCPEMTDGAGLELTGLPRCILYKFFFSGFLRLPFPHLPIRSHLGTLALPLPHTCNTFLHSHAFSHTTPINNPRFTPPRD